MSRRSAHLHVHGDTAPWLQPGKSCLPCHHRSALVAGDDVTRTRSRSQDKQSIGSLSWTKRLLSVWNVENIKVVKRVIVSVVGATVLLIGVALLVLPFPAFIVIPIGLAILPPADAWPPRWLIKTPPISAHD